MVRKPLLSWPARRSPASVGLIERVVRLSNRTPRLVSRLRTRWLNADVVTPSSIAAFAILPCRTIVMKMFRSASVALSTVEPVIEGHHEWGPGENNGKRNVRNRAQVRGFDERRNQVAISGRGA